MSIFIIQIMAALGALAQSTDGSASPTQDVTSVPLPSSPSSLPARFAVDDERLGVESPWYWSVGASFVTTRSAEGPGEEIDFDEGWGLQLALGHRYFGATDDGMMLDVELEGLYSDQESKSSGAPRPIDDLNTAAVMLNGLVALHIADETEFFLGAGIGLGWLDIGTRSDSLSSFDDEDGPFFAWQVKAGVRFALGSATDLEVGYRFLDIDDAEIDDGIGDLDFELATQQHSVGVTVRFGA
jgi:opacity protein-like surface antigen